MVRCYIRGSAFLPNQRFHLNSTIIYYRHFILIIMEATKTSTTLLDSYAGLLNRLSPNDKLELIARLTASVKSDLAAEKSSFKESFGAFESEQSAEEIIDDIRNSRVATRQLESF